ncbi:MAG: hypothetical protein DRG78_24200 [Epsilonproteobacteria bacterium]|nr:MAG: hypothetical protein DRG78_24200 [Campylobacterota bacterium]
MKILLILIFSSLLLIASSANQHQVKILEKIFSEISIGKDIKIWSDNQDILIGLTNNQNFSTTQNSKDANVIILKDATSIDKITENQTVFVLEYKLLSTVKKSFGALFWKKGRPNIVIVEPRIKMQSIEITKELEPYLEEKIW